MPKEIIREYPDEKSAFVDVRWGTENFECLQIGIDGFGEFSFVNEVDDPDGPYTGLFIQFYSAEQVDRLIKALERAKRQTFQ